MYELGRGLETEDPYVGRVCVCVWVCVCARARALSRSAVTNSLQPYGP